MWYWSVTYVVLAKDLYVTVTIDILGLSFINSVFKCFVIKGYILFCHIFRCKLFCSQLSYFCLVVFIAKHSLYCLGYFIRSATICQGYM